MSCEIIALDSDLIQCLIFIALIIFLQFFLRKKRSNLVKNKPKFVTEPFKILVKGLKIKNTKPILLAIAIASSIALDFAYTLAYPDFQLQLGKFSIVSTVIFHPIIEEFICRGLFFGALLFTINTTARRFDLNIAARYPLIFLAVIVQASFFALLHETILSFYQAMLLAGLFIGHRRMGGKYNILAPITAHATHNIIIVISNCV